MKKRELSMMEELILNSMEFDAVCQKCGRAVHITPADLIWQFGLRVVNDEGKVLKVKPAGFLYRCVCENEIPVAISVGVDNDRLEKKGESNED